MFITLLILLAVIGAVVAYWFLMRSLYMEWGATDSEVFGAMVGDERVPRPDCQLTFGITIFAPPADIWPWLVQMGKGRGGLYSYDWLDRTFGYLDAPSANRLLPEFQRLAAGDMIPIGRGGDFPVTAVEPDRALVLSRESRGVQWTWQFGLQAVSAHRTRLVSRNRIRMNRTIGSVLLMRALEPATFIMTRKMLLGIKRRAEALAKSHELDAGRPAA